MTRRFSILSVWLMTAAVGTACGVDVEPGSGSEYVTSSDDDGSETVRFGGDNNFVISVGEPKRFWAFELHGSARVQLRIRQRDDSAEVDTHLRLERHVDGEWQLVEDNDDAPTLGRDKEKQTSTWARIERVLDRGLYRVTASAPKDPTASAKLTLHAVCGSDEEGACPDEPASCEDGHQRGLPPAGVFTAQCGVELLNMLRVPYIQHTQSVSTPNTCSVKGEELDAIAKDEAEVERRRGDGWLDDDEYAAARKALGLRKAWAGLSARAVEYERQLFDASIGSENRRYRTWGDAFHVEAREHATAVKYPDSDEAPVTSGRIVVPSSDTELAFNHDGELVLAFTHEPTWRTEWYCEGDAIEAPDEHCVWDAIHDIAHSADEEAEKSGSFTLGQEDDHMRRHMAIAVRKYAKDYAETLGLKKDETVISYHITAWGDYTADPFGDGRVDGFEIALSVVGKPTVRLLVAKEYDRSIRIVARDDNQGARWDCGEHAEW